MPRNSVGRFGGKGAVAATLCGSSPMLLAAAWAAVKTKAFGFISNQTNPNGFAPPYSILNSQFSTLNSQHLIHLIT
jgi:hypothetical protein